MCWSDVSIILFMTSKDENTVVNDKLQSTLYIWSDSKTKGFLLSNKINTDQQKVALGLGLEGQLLRVLRANVFCNY